LILADESTVHAAVAPAQREEIDMTPRDLHQPNPESQVEHRFGAGRKLPRRQLNRSPGRPLAKQGHTIGKSYNATHRLSPQL
jgi:hypothetical protein